jgi:fumarate reductase flavoprotein subunit
MASGKSDDISKMSADIVIIGAGGAGLSAALTAVENGVNSVIVVEKRARTGGNTALATGLFACESPVQARQKIVADRDVLFHRAMDWAHWSRVNPAVLRAFINKSGDTIRWLESKGLEFDLIRFYPDQVPLVQHNPEGGGAGLVKVLERECRGLGVRFLIKTDCRKIVCDNKGNVNGIIVTSDGQEIRIDTGGVIIATGGFAGNKELMKKYGSEYTNGMALSGLPLKGDGLYLAAGVGAAIEEYATIIKEGPRFDLHSWPLMHFERDPYTLWVNKNGERFVDEAVGYHVFESVNAMVRQPDKVSYALFDTDIKKQFEEKMPGLEEALQAEAKKGRVKIAGSWEEIAVWIGAAPEILKATVERYSYFCERGYDEDFVKERRYLVLLNSPPYYAIRGVAAILDTIGGIRINERMEVLNRQNRKITGLYACGVVTSGWESEIYCSDLSASAFGFAVNSGRIAGDNSSRFVATRKQ